MNDLYTRIEELSFDEFEQLIAFVSKNRQERVEKILTAANQKVARLNLDLGEVKSKKRGRKAKRVVTKQAKYRNPADAHQTWSGLGRQPVWFKDYLKNGGRAEDLLI